MRTSLAQRNRREPVGRIVILQRHDDPVTIPALICKRLDHVEQFIPRLRHRKPFFRQPVLADVSVTQVVVVRNPVNLAVDREQDVSVIEVGYTAQFFDDIVHRNQTALLFKQGDMADISGQENAVLGRCAIGDRNFRVKIGQRHRFGHHFDAGQLLVFLPGLFQNLHGGRGRFRGSNANRNGLLFRTAAGAGRSGIAGTLRSVPVLRTARHASAQQSRKQHDAKNPQPYFPHVFFLSSHAD